MEKINDYYIIDKKTDMLVDMISLTPKEYRRYLKSNPKYRLEIVEDLVEDEDDDDDDYNTLIINLNDVF